jgi:hypothetical protein
MESGIKSNLKSLSLAGKLIDNETIKIEKIFTQK